MANTNRALRCALKREVDEKLCSAEEIRPFITAWEVICERFDGVALLDDTLDPVPHVHYLLEAETIKNDMVTEEVFVAWLLSLPILKKNITNSLGEVWEPIQESFDSFNKKDSKLKVSDIKSGEYKLKEFYSWVVELCDWKNSASIFGVTKPINYH